MDSIIYNHRRYIVINLYLNTPKFMELTSRRLRKLVYEYSSFWNYLLINSILKYDRCAIRYMCKGSKSFVIMEVVSVLFDNGHFSILFGHTIAKEVSHVVEY